MFVYKITNTNNGKVYIGQTIRPIEQRFHRHLNDAENNNLDTHFARAIRKYGRNSFKIECIDTAETQEELTRKEYYWIEYYNSANPQYGYNETTSCLKCGGNTYINKTENEMAVIGSKIRESKTGDKNPNAKSVKCKNIVSGEELVFTTVKECQEYFNEHTHRFITTRTNGTVRSLYKGQWAIAYEGSSYEYVPEVRRRGKKVSVKDVKTKIEATYESIRMCARELHIDRTKIRSSSGPIIIDNYEITMLD